MTTLLLVTLLGIFILSMAISILFLLITRNTSELTLTNQIQNNIGMIVEREAAIIDLKFKRYSRYIKIVTDYINEMYKSKKFLHKNRLDC